MTYLKQYKTNCIVFLLSIACFAPSYASDSLRTETVNGKRVIVHKVDQGQTLYSLARKYNVNVNEIKSLNPSLVQLQIGMEVLIPNKNETVANETSATTEAPASKSPSSEQIHRVQQGETLYRISKQYGLSPQELSEYNKIGSGGIKVGQELRIPRKNSLSQANDSAPIPSTPPPADNSKPKIERKTSASGYPSITESGNAQFNASSSEEPFYLVQHKTAPIGTILFIKNKENGNTAHAKVVSNLKPNGPDATVVTINKLVYDKLEAKTGTFPVEISYTPEK